MFSLHFFCVMYLNIHVYVLVHFIQSVIHVYIHVHVRIIMYCVCPIHVHVYIHCQGCIEDFFLGGDSTQYLSSTAFRRGLGENI